MRRSNLDISEKLICLWLLINLGIAGKIQNVVIVKSYVEVISIITKELFPS